MSCLFQFTGKLFQLFFLLNELFFLLCQLLFLFFQLLLLTGQFPVQAIFSTQRQIHGNQQAHYQ